MDKLTKEQEQKEIDKIVEMGSLLAPIEAFEKMLNVWGIHFVDCTPSDEQYKKTNKSKK